MRNSSLVERQGVDDNRASSILPKLRVTPLGVAVGEHSNLRRSRSVRDGEAVRKANVGISNDNEGEKPSHQKTKVSPAMLISRGLVGT